MIKCNVCNKEKPLKGTYFTKRNGKYLLDKCKHCRNHKPQKLDNFCGICKSSVGLVYMSNAKTAPKTLCDIHHFEYQQVQERLIYHNLQFVEYRNMLITQQGTCAICKIHSENLVIDHCHISGNIRALLCSKCNMYLGVIENTIADGTYLKYIQYSQTYAEQDISNLKPSF